MVRGLPLYHSLYASVCLCIGCYWCMCLCISDYIVCWERGVCVLLSSTKKNYSPLDVRYSMNRKMMKYPMLGSSFLCFIWLSIAIAISSIGLR